MAEVIALLYPELCYRGVCYKSVPLYLYVICIYIGTGRCGGLKDLVGK